MPITALIALRTVAVAALLAETAARAGTGAVSWCHPGGSRAQRAALALLLGWVTLGFLAFGLALGGVLTAHAVLAGTVALLAASGGLRLRPFLLVRVMRGAAGAGPWWAAAGIAATVSLWPLLVAPESTTDCFIYHLGLPWHALRLHKLPPDAAPWLFHVPALFDFTQVIPLLLHDDRLARWSGVGCLLAAQALWAERARARGRPRAAWLGALFVLALPPVLRVTTTAKCDLAAVALFAAGAGLCAGRNVLVG
ncbi:MAG: hypothetical protein AAB368_01325, partial [bacterium]